MKLNAIVVGLLGIFTVHGANAGSEDLALKLETALQQELAPTTSRPALPQALRTKVSGFGSVLVAGVLGEFLPGYFSHNAESLKGDFGQTHVDTISPFTCTDEESNAKSLDAQFRSRGRSRPLIVLGHSKGGAEALLALIRDPALVRQGIVDRLVLISGAVGGSAVADIHNIPGGETICPGTYDLRRDVSHAHFADAIATLSADDRALIASRVFYVRAEKDTSEVATVFKGSAEYLTVNFGPNDGMMLPDDEWIAGFGTDLGILNADHSDLVGWGPYTGSPPELKRAFTRALMRALYE